MTAQTKAALKARFTSGTEVSAADFGDLIDSFINLAESSAQTVASPVVFNETVTFTTASGTRLQASTLTTSGMVVTGTASATTATPRFTDVSASSVNVGVLSAATISVDEMSINGVSKSGTKEAGINVPVSNGSIAFSATAAWIQATGSTTNGFLGSDQLTSGLAANVKFSSMSDGSLKYLGSRTTTKFLCLAQGTYSHNGAERGRIKIRLGKEDSEGSAVTYPETEVARAASGLNSIATLNIIYPETSSRYAIYATQISAIPTINPSFQMITMVEL